MITVFTPTFNRAYTLPILYKSLLRQTDKDFEWIIVDDGSIDDTENLVSDWRNNTNGFPIIYFKQENSGKHIAINKGVNLANGELFFIVDSDDYIVDDAIEIIKKYAATIIDIKNIAGIAGLRIYKNGTIIGTTFFNKDYLDITSLEREKYNVNGDKAEVIYTDILKKYPFPTFGDEKFLTENVVWYSIAAANYKLRWFNEPIIICEYLEDGLTRNSTAIRNANPMGWMYTYKLYYQYKKGLRNKYAAIYHYYELAVSVGKNSHEITRSLGISRIKLKLALFAHKVFGK